MRLYKSFVLIAVLAVSNATTAFMRAVQHRGLVYVAPQKHSSLAFSFKQPIRSSRLLASTAGQLLSPSLAVRSSSHSTITLSLDG